MGRSRSRSPRRERRRSRSKERHRDKKHRSSRHERRSRSRSPPLRRENERRRSRSPRRDKRSRDRHRHSRDKDPYQLPPSGEVIEILDGDDITDVVEIDCEEVSEEADMMKLMGFAGFDSTKGKHVEGNNISASNITHKRKYRQYMNRRGGFNRPLDFVP